MFAGTTSDLTSHNPSHTEYSHKIAAVVRMANFTRCSCFCCVTFSRLAADADSMAGGLSYRSQLKQRRTAESKCPANTSKHKQMGGDYCNVPLALWVLKIPRTRAPQWPPAATWTCGNVDTRWCAAPPPRGRFTYELLCGKPGVYAAFILHSRRGKSTVCGAE